MKTQDFINSLKAIVSEYVSDEEAYGDDVQLQINTENWELDIAEPEEDVPGCDYYPIMDLIRMSTERPGTWEPDEEAIVHVAAEYSLPE